MSEDRRPQAAEDDAPARRNSAPAIKGKSTLTSAMKAAAAVTLGAARRTVHGVLGDRDEGEDHPEKDAAAAGAHHGPKFVPPDRASSVSALGTEAGRVGNRLRAAAASLRGSGGKAGRVQKMEAQRRMSRRRRSSKFPPARTETQRSQGSTTRTKAPVGYLELREAHAMPAPAGSRDGEAAAGAGLAAALLVTTGKAHLCDAEVTGKDGVAVAVPALLLACHSPVFEAMLFRGAGAGAGAGREEGVAAAAAATLLSPDEPRKVRLPFAAAPALRAAVHFCAALALPPDVAEGGRDDEEAHVRALAQLQLLGRLFRMPALADAAYRAARRRVNRRPPLACAAFDECVALAAQAAAEGHWGLAAAEERYYDDLGEYALGCLREAPAGAVSGPESRVDFLSAAALGEVMRDQEIDVDEYGMWCMLNAWVIAAPGTKEEKIAVAKPLASHLRLVFIDPEKLQFIIKKCGFVDPDKIEEALKEIEFMLENESPEDKERVIVEGAGDDRVNGVYILADDEVGLMTDEVMFLKQGDDDEHFSSDFGLYCWDETWKISDCTNYSNALYSCALRRHKGHSKGKPPKWGWRCEEGPEKAPTCTWKPSKEEVNADAAKQEVVPALSKLKHEKGKTAGRCDPGLEKSMTLDQMMSLPEDAVSADNFRYASVSKDLLTMMDMPVDEGHDDEEGGYDVNYMSATKFWTSADLEDKDGKSKPFE